MKIKTTLAAIALCLAPSLTLAMGCSDAKDQTTASSCKAGTTRDAAAGNCGPTPSS